MIGIQTCSIFKNILVNVFSIFLLLTNISMANAQPVGAPNNTEKTIIIKGLYIGMDIDEAKRIMEQLVGKDWIVSPIGLTEKVVADYRFTGGEKYIFGEARTDGAWRHNAPPMTGEKGFAIQSKESQSYEGYVSADVSNISSKKVTGISLGGKLADYVFGTKGIDMEVFVTEFAKSYNLPELNWMPHGWIYTSEQKGYTLQISIYRFVELKKDQIKVKNNPKIKFN